MTQPIVALYDGSEFSKRAFPWAADLARRLSAPLHIVRAHVFGAADEKALSKPRYARTTMVHYERDDLEQVAAGVPADVSATPVLLEDGPPIPQLIEYVRQQNAAWVVMATHGRGGFSRFWLGSTAVSVIRDCDVPIFLLPGQRDYTNQKVTHIAAATDGSAVSETIIDPVAVLARAFDANVTLVELVSAFEVEEAVYDAAPDEPPFDAQAAAESFINWKLAKHVERLAAEGVRAASLVRPITEPVAPSLLQAVADLGAEILALSTHGRGFWSRAAFGSVADKVLRTADIPLVIYHPPGS